GEILKLEPDTSRIPALADLDPHLFYLAWTVVLKTRRPRSSIDNVFLFVMDDNPIEIVDVTSRYREGQDLADADKLLGQMVVEEGYTSQDKVEQALAAQKRTGELLVEAGDVLPGQVERLVHRQQAAREARLATTIRVDVDKLDRLVNLVGEMVISVSRACGALRSAPTDENQGAAEALEAIGRQMQDRVMMLRMVPVEGTFARFQRVVRDLSQELGRQIGLVTEGNETELDKSVIERLVDPLKHLVRNAACHGIEPPDERLRKGKPAEGTIVLRARQQSGSIYVEVEDDGRGLDRLRIAARAREMGLLNQPDLPPDAELLPLMFEPGFSTVTEVSEIAGRGVGLDVVRRNIQELRGHIQVRSIPSKSTCFQLRLPLTLAIIDTITVSVGGAIFCIPMLSVLEQFRPAARDLRTVEGRGEVVMLRGELLPMVRLHRLFDLPDAQLDPTRALVVVVENGSHVFALLVDDVLAQAQAVIKPLDVNFRRVPGFSGATILGDGRPSLILDIDALQRIAFRSTSPVVPRPTGPAPTQETPCLP
ncbi:MAG: chemotaxis protein CheA, partial [Oligoflexia bacterium]|nr:chemotaxis protein CheA [Oligoflexia bacterium]